MPSSDHMLDTLRVLFVKCQSQMISELMRAGYSFHQAQAEAFVYCNRRVLGNQAPTVRPTIGVPQRPAGVLPLAPKPGGLLGPY